MVCWPLHPKLCGSACNALGTTYRLGITLLQHNLVKKRSFSVARPKNAGETRGAVVLQRWSYKWSHTMIKLVMTASATERFRMLRNILSNVIQMPVAHLSHQPYQSVVDMICKIYPDELFHKCKFKVSTDTFGKTSQSCHTK